MITGPGLDGTFMVAAADMRKNPDAADVVMRFHTQGYDPPGFTLYAYAAVQVWARAVEAAGSLDLGAVIDAMHSRQFDTVLGRIGFDEKGDVTGLRPVGMVRLAGGRQLRAARAKRHQEVVSEDGRARQLFRIAAGRAGAQNSPPL